MRLERSDRLAELLHGAAVPHREGAKERAVAAIAGQSDLLADSQSSPLRLRLGLALLAVLALSLAGFMTPPGRAVAEWAAELVGVGEVGGPPTKPSEVGPFTVTGDQIVLATGQTADHVDYEIVAYKSDRTIEGAQGTTVCVNTEFPSVRSDGSGSCYAGALRYGGLCCSQVVLENRATSIPYIEGQVSPEVESVSVSYTDQAGNLREVQAVIGMITPRFASALEVEHPSGLFMTSLPDLAEYEPENADTFRGPAEPVQITAVGGDGQIIETETYDALTDRIAEAEKAREALRQQCAGSDIEELPPGALPDVCREALGSGGPASAE
jgi:hypothetical protein